MHIPLYNDYVSQDTNKKYINFIVSNFYMLVFNTITMY
ncbi:hypothetical protein KL86DPRO_20569 [uncultured delta proteobacterium]|uniref:Uncharacterized protein n=1 Tax=uncultured delta proteobacterium TaxID=34034 RepID=A0A212K2F4_9DELT|nr:hypothetical protein KL86DPRO_20569 [uncultured delta proteobacterium]